MAQTDYEQQARKIAEHSGQFLVEIIAAALQAEHKAGMEEAAESLIDAVRELQERLPCGHRKIDMDDSYGECVFCKYRQKYWDDEKEHSDLLAQLAAKDKEIAELREEIIYWRSRENELQAREHGD